MTNAFKIAGAYIGVIVGAGFASGQEILQFFTSFGWISVVGTCIATVLFAFLGMQLLQIGSRMGGRLTQKCDLLDVREMDRIVRRCTDYIFPVRSSSGDDCWQRGDF
ncbi:hypothetical protein [Pseudobacillus badius]|uniref:hypothetical protein n=1 Tax=Bacillus badius TaxID=1455 RepID=UPI0010EE54DF|nr:hypothetical protein [Bacillus badius]TDW05731.1 hypothetical protein B0G66_101157 [Bacillus badius]